MKPAHAYLILELPQGFPAPHTDQFQPAVELLMYTVGMVVTANGNEQRTLNLACSYRAEGDPIYTALRNEPHPGVQ